MEAKKGNTFALLARVEHNLSTPAPRHTARRTQQKCSSCQEDADQAEKPEAGNTKESKSAKEEEVEEVWLDSYLWSFIFSLLHDGPLLASLRQVCARWRDLIDEDKRLWKGLLVHDFRWRKDRRRGKGRAKKNKKEHVYKDLYIQLYIQRRTTQKNIAREEQLRRERITKTSNLMSKLMPYMIERYLQGKNQQNSRLREEDHPWRICPHPEECISLPDHTKRPAEWTYCRACGVTIRILDGTHKYWWAHYPKLLDAPYHGSSSDIEDKLRLLAKKVQFDPTSNPDHAFGLWANHLAARSS